MKKRTNSRGTVLVLGVFTIASILAIINSKPKIETKELEINKTNIQDNKNTIAIHVKENDDGEYTEKDTIPDGNYEIDTQSYCTKGNSTNRITTPMEYKDGKVYIKTDTSNSKCYVYLNKVKPPTAEDTLADLKLEVSKSGCPTIGEDGLPTYALSNETSLNGYLCEGIDDDGKTYYFRGNVSNNWVKMGGTYWRIIRINGDGSIRLIYNGTNTSDTGTVTTGVSYNTTSNDNKYVGFMYGNSSTDYTAAITNTNISNILTELNKWYEGSEFPTEYKGLLDENAGFCNDRTPYNGNSSSSQIDTSKYGFGKSETYYGAYIRVLQTKKPTFKCPQPNNDLFTKKGSEKGNGALTNPIGLITADEVMYAGAVYNTENRIYWLHNNQEYWTMSPSHFNTTYDNTWVFRVDNDFGSLYYNLVNNANPKVRPVINIKAGTKFTTNSDKPGTTSDPFTVSLQ